MCTVSYYHCLDGKQTDIYRLKAEEYYPEQVTLKKAHHFILGTGFKKVGFGVLKRLQYNNDLCYKFGKAPASGLIDLGKKDWEPVTR